MNPRHIAGNAEKGEVAWTLAGGHMVNATLNLFGFIFLHILQLIRMEFNMAMNYFKLNIQIPLLSEINETKEMIAILPSTQKKKEKKEKKKKKPLTLTCIQTFMNRSSLNMSL